MTQKQQPSRAKSGARIYAGSYLVWAMIAMIMVLWAMNIRELILDYRYQKQTRIERYQEQELDNKRDALEFVFHELYEHVRTISLLPNIRSAPGGNRLSEEEDAVAQGRMSLDTHHTIEQIYRNLAGNIQLSEIYYVLDGFKPDTGEVPFFMYDDEIAGINSGLEDPTAGLDDESDIPDEYEEDEYDYYVEQLSKFRSLLKDKVFTGDIGQVPALMSPLMRTCDNTQYASLTYGDELDSHGLLYSVAVFDNESGRFKGLISSVLRANVLESLLLGVPFIPVTEPERSLAQVQGWALPEAKSNFVLINELYDIKIQDRRHDRDFKRMDLDQLKQQPGQLTHLDLDVASDGQWQLYHYMTPAEVATLTAELDRKMWFGVGSRVALMLVLLAIFWRANRDQIRHHQELVRLAHYDTLTTLPNRSLLLRHLEQSMSRADRHQKKLGLMFIDIDEFGSINDSLGHKAGDQVLMAIADRLHSSIRVSDELAAMHDDSIMPQVARIGGDDFAVIFEDLDKPEDGVMLGERLLLRFKEPINLSGQRTEISLSGGMAVYPDDGNDIDGLMACADYALRHATEQGSGRFQMYNDEMRQKAARHTCLMRDLPNAIRFELFTLNYQPKQSLVDDTVVSFEALIRWHHEELGFVSPVEFIPLLEQSGYIVEAGRWVMETACRQLKEWQKTNPALCMSVNVSPRQMMLSDIVTTVDEVLELTGVEPDTLILEVTESMMIDNLEEGQRTLQALRDRGVRLAIDDFGTGYSSLTYLQGLPVNYLKLDKSMIDVIDDEKGAHVIRATIDLAHGLGLVSVAEGVEEFSQRQALKAMGCDLLQGYWLSRPLPADQAMPYVDGSFEMEDQVS